jgi:hypothetical protein
MKADRETRRAVRRIARRWGRPTLRRLIDEGGRVIVRRAVGRYVVQVLAFQGGIVFLAGEHGGHPFDWLSDDVYDIDDLRSLFANVDGAASFAELVGRGPK